MQKSQVPLRDLVLKNEVDSFQVLMPNADLWSTHVCPHKHRYLEERGRERKEEGKGKKTRKGEVLV